MCQRLFFAGFYKLLFAVICVLPGVLYILNKGPCNHIDLDMSRLHNDSTTVKAYGKIAGTTRDGLKMANGKSKDYRPDLAQLVFSLTISSDGAVPIHYKTYPGNRTDDTTHIETWNN